MCHEIRNQEGSTLLPWSVTSSCPAPARCYGDGFWPCRCVSGKIWCGGPGSRRTLGWGPCWRGRAVCGLHQSKRATVLLGQTSTPRRHPPIRTNRYTQWGHLKDGVVVDWDPIRVMIALRNKLHYNLLQQSEGKMISLTSWRKSSQDNKTSGEQIQYYWTLCHFGQKAGTHQVNDQAMTGDICEHLSP